MRILSRYLTLRFLNLFVLILCISTLAIVIVEMLLNFDDMVENESSLKAVATYLVLRIPSYYLRDLLLISVFAAVFFSLGLAAHWLELTAAKAGGVSTGRIALPILVAAAGIGCVSFVVNETLVIAATEGWKQQLRGGSRSISFRRGTFWYHRGDTIYNIAAANPAEHTLSGVNVFELSPEGRLLRSIHADRANIEDDSSWQLENATIRHFGPAGDSERPDRALSVERVARTALVLDESSGRALLDADTTSLSLLDLRQYVAQRQQSGDPADRERTLFHKRVSEPVTILALALLALPLALRVESALSLALPAVYGVATVAAFFALRNATITLASASVLPAPAGAWGGLLLFMSLAIWQLSRAR